MDLGRGSGINESPVPERSPSKMRFNKDAVKHGSPGFIAGDQNAMRMQMKLFNFNLLPLIIFVFVSFCSISSKPIITRHDIDDSKSEIYIMNSDGSHLIQITFDQY